jgi:hypothetical protein
VVVREVVRDGGGGGGSMSYPTLTKTNYTEWAILMRVALQGAGLWDVVEFDEGTERQERQALGAIYVLSHRRWYPCWRRRTTPKRRGTRSR